MRGGNRRQTAVPMITQEDKSAIRRNNEAKYHMNV
jgi:hypothetical protein